MKVKTLSRNMDECLRETKKDIHKVPRNYDKNLHPFEASREYVRAVNSAKLERVFAKPFLGSLDGHRDGISCVSKHPSKLSRVYTGACDGEIRVWNLPTRKCIQSIVAHDGSVSGIAYNPSGEYFFSCGYDRIIKQWRADDTDFKILEEPVNTIIGKTIFRGIDHHWQDNIFATCGDRVDVWNEERVEPIRSYPETDGVTSLKFNPVEGNILAATCGDLGITIYDIRNTDRFPKPVLTSRANNLCWNPMEPLYFTCACNDFNLYTFDMRKLDTPVNVHMGHVNSVIDIDYSPTGREFVSGSIDKTIRIFKANRGMSRDVYHTKRMQSVNSVKWTSDDRFLLSASSEMNLRVWKAHASEKLGVLRPREKEAFNYSSSLKGKFAAHPQVQRILRHRHVPNAIYAKTKELRIMKDAEKKKDSRRRATSKPGSVPYVPERQKNVTKVVE